MKHTIQTLNEKFGYNRTFTERELKIIFRTNNNRGIETRYLSVVHFSKEQKKAIFVNTNLMIVNVTFGDVVYFEGLNCEEGHTFFKGFIGNQEVQGYLNNKTESIYRLESVNNLNDRGENSLNMSEKRLIKQ